MTDYTADATYWQNRYQSGQTGWDIGYASPPLMEYALRCLNKNHRILIPGAGYSHEATALWKKGFTNVYVCDYADSALEKFLQRTPDFNKNNIFHSDFFTLTSVVGFEVILEQTFFCALPRNQRKKYFEKCRELLVPGGILAGVWFSVEFEQPGPPFGGSPEEYKSYIDMRHWKIKKWEACRNSIEPRKGREWWMELKRL